MAPRLPELIKRARRLAHERDRLVQELARDCAEGDARGGVQVRRLAPEPRSVTRR